MDTALTLIVIAGVVAVASLAAVFFLSSARRNRLFEPTRVLRDRDVDVIDVIEDPVVADRPRLARPARPGRVATVRRTEERTYEDPVDTTDELRRPL